MTICYFFQIPSKQPKRKMSTSESNLLSKKDMNLISVQQSTVKPISRLLLISYFPSGFWSRLMIRILADIQMGEIAQNVYHLDGEVSTSSMKNLRNKLKNHLFFKFNRQQKVVKHIGSYGKQDSSSITVIFSYSNCVKCYKIVYALRIAMK